jgi:hypothetical protein
MDVLGELWLPIVLSAVFVFLVSSVLHMLLPIHKSDFRKLPGEEPLTAEMRKRGVGPGAYAFPHCGSMKEMSSPEMKARLAQGPVGTLIVRSPASMNMGAALAQWFLFTLVVGLLVAHIAWPVLPRGAHYTHVFHVVGLASFLAYGFSSVTDSIWKGMPWSTSFKFLFDGLLYALVTAGTFGWLWPQGA